MAFGYFKTAIKIELYIYIYIYIRKCNLNISNGLLRRSYGVETVFPGRSFGRSFVHS